MSTENEVIEFNDKLYSTYIGEPHDIPSHRRQKSHSWNKPSILIDCLAILLIGLLGGFVIESGILQSPPRVEALDIPLILTLPSNPNLTTQPPTVDSPREIVDNATRSLQRKPLIPKSTVTSGQSKVERMVSYALAQQGDRYRWGASGPNAFDCSGLVVASFKSIGITLYHYTGDLLKHGTHINRGSLKRGDLVFPTSSHVGIYLGNNKMVVASSGKGRVIIQTIYSFYAGRRLL